MARSPRTSAPPGVRAAFVVFAALVSAPLAGSIPRPTAVADTAKFNQIIDQTTAAMLGDPARAARLAHDAMSNAAAWPAGSDRDLAVAKAQWLEGEAAFRTDDIATAQSLTDFALKTIARIAPGSKLNADLLLLRARIAVEQGKPQAGLGDLQSAYRMFYRLGDARSEAKALQSIGSIYQDAQDFGRVLDYYQSARETYPSDDMLALSSSNNMANAYARTGRVGLAESEYKRALVIARRLKSPLLAARILANLADLEIDRRDLPAARATIGEGLTLTSGPRAKAERPMLLGTLARLELAEGRPEAAVRAVEAALAQSADSITDQAYRPIQLTAYRAYKVNGDYRRALEHLEAFRALDDAGRTLATSTSSALMAARFDSVNQKASIEKLEADGSRAEARQRTMLLIGLLILIAGAALFLIVYLRSLRRSRNEILAANLQLEQTNTDLAEALLAKSQFLATTSHEIRTPLNGILGMTQVMLADRTVTGAVRERLGLVDSAGRSMRSLVDDILDFAKMDSGALAIESGPVDIAAVLPDLVALWRVEATDKGIGLQLDLAETLVPIVTDIVRLRQIIFNLLSNALKFTTEGSVRIAATPVSGDDGEQLVIAFRDTGVGIPAAAFETIFEPFRQLDTSTTRRFGGTGLGLAISRHLARALGGDITVDSVLGAGSTFSLRLPYLRAATTAPVVTGGQRQAGARPRLLIAGANPIGRSMLRTRLDPHFDRCAACDLDEVSERVAHGFVDIVLIDADGLAAETIAALAARLDHSDLTVAVLAPAASSLADDLRDVAAVIVKPISIDGLVAALAELLDAEIAVASA